MAAAIMKIDVAASRSEQLNAADARMFVGATPSAAVCALKNDVNCVAAAAAVSARRHRQRDSEDAAGNLRNRTG